MAAGRHFEFKKKTTENQVSRFFQLKTMSI